VPTTESFHGKIFVYDGLYSVAKYWNETGTSGYNVCKYLFERLKGQKRLTSSRVHAAARDLCQRDGLVMDPMTGQPYDLSGGVEAAPVWVFDARRSVTADQSRPIPVHMPPHPTGDMATLAVTLLKDQVPSGPFGMAFVYTSKPLYTPSAAPRKGAAALPAPSDRELQDLNAIGCQGSRIAPNDLYPYDCGGKLPAGRGPTPLVYEASVGRAQCCMLSKGIQVPLEVFRSGDERKGWGLRCRQRLMQWEFICEYTGIVALASEREHQIGHLAAPGEDKDAYAFDLELRGDHVLQEVLEETEEQALQRQEEANGLPVPNKQGVQEMLAHAGLTEDDCKGVRFILDAARVGNVSRFVNHDGEHPNVFVQMVATPAAPDGTGSDPRAPRIGFFALQDIPQMTELTFDYGKGYQSKFAKGTMASGPKRGGCA